MPRPLRTACLLLLGCCVLPAARGSAQGFVYPGVGAVNRSMAGAAVAAPLDAVGALHWNPAAVSGLAASELVVGVELHMPRSRLGATAPAGAFGPGSPELSDVVGSHTGATLLPNVAWVHQPRDSLWSYGLGVISTGGFDLNYAASADHPITSPDGYALGALSSEFRVLQVVPTISRQLNDHWAVGLAPVLTIAEMSFSNALFAAPDDASGDGVFSYPDASFSPMRYGIGFQAGVYLTTDSRWHLGASVKSKQWIEEFAYRTTDELGGDRTLSTRIEHPMILSLGAAYSGLPRLLTALDVRYIGYSQADFFGDDARFRADGSLNGLGWRDSMSASLGCQYLLNRGTSVRLGYAYGQSPVPNAATSQNLQSGELWNHMLTTGCTVHLSSYMSLSVAYVRTFDKTTSGVIRTADGALPGTEVAVGQRADAITTGISMQF